MLLHCFIQEPAVIATASTGKVDRPRPQVWYEIAQHAIVNGIQSAQKVFSQHMTIYSPGASRRAIARWMHDIRRGRGPTDHLNAHRWRESVVGKDLEAIVVGQLQTRAQAGLTLDNGVLANLIRVQLELHGKANLLVENGGFHTFGPTWCHR